MKAAYYERNQQIRIGEIKAIEPGRGEVAIEVAYCGICGTDLGIYHGKMDWRVAESQIMGHEVSGVVQAIGPGVTEVNIGDRVTVMPLDPCGDCPACHAGLSHICENLKFLGIDTPGAFQGRWTVPAHTVHRLPDTLPLSRAALIEPIAVACHDIRLGQLVPGNLAVVLGGGPIGALVGMVAQDSGARVLVSEINPYRIKLLQELGLEAVDPRSVDLPALVKESSHGAGADVVFEVTGNPSAARLMTRLPRARGLIVVVGIFAQPAEINLFDVFWRELQLRGARVYERQDFERAIKIADSGTLPLDHIISEVYPLAELKKGLDQMSDGAEVMKILIQCKEDNSDG